MSHCWCLGQVGTVRSQSKKVKGRISSASSSTLYLIARQRASHFLLSMNTTHSQNRCVCFTAHSNKQQCDAPQGHRSVWELRGYMDIYLFCIVQKEFIFIKIAEAIVIEMGIHAVFSLPLIAKHVQFKDIFANVCIKEKLEYHVNKCIPLCCDRVAHAVSIFSSSLR